MLQTRNRYSPKFKEQAVELVRIGKPVAEVAEELGIGTGLIYWISKRRIFENYAVLKKAFKRVSNDKNPIGISAVDGLAQA